MIGTLRRELLDRLLIVNQSHLRQVLTEYLQHYNTARPHRALGQLTPAQADTQRPDPVNLAEHRIRRKQVLGGLTREYYIAALPPSVATGKHRSPPESYFRAPQDVAAILQTYPVDEVIALGMRSDPGLEEADFAAAGRRLDQLDDLAFARYGADTAWLRRQFATWPRAAPTRRR